LFGDSLMSGYRLEKRHHLSSVLENDFNQTCYMSCNYLNSDQTVREMFIRNLFDREFIYFYVPRILENDIENLEVGLARAVHINARQHHYFFHTN